MRVVETPGHLARPPTRRRRRRRGRRPAARRRSARRGRAPRSGSVRSGDARADARWLAAAARSPRRRWTRPSAISIAGRSAGSARAAAVSSEAIAAGYSPRRARSSPIRAWAAAASGIAEGDGRRQVVDRLAIGEDRLGPVGGLEERRGRLGRPARLALVPGDQREPGQVVAARRRPARSGAPSAVRRWSRRRRARLVDS